MNKNIKLVSIFLQLKTFFFLCLLIVLPVEAATFSAPAQDPDGSYTLSWSGIGTHVQLYEKKNGLWTAIYGGTALSYPVTGKGEGVYEYKLDNYCVVPPVGARVCETLYRNVIVGYATPTISVIPSVTMNEDAVGYEVNFTVNDLDTSLSMLKPTVAVSNPAIISSTGFAFSGSDQNRKLILTPNANASGSAVVTVRITDDKNKFSETSFNLTVNAVNDLPTISSIGPQVIDENSSTAVLSFNVNDVENGGDLDVAATSNNSTLVPSSGIILAGSGNNRSIKIIPALYRAGSAEITVTVSDRTAPTPTIHKFTVTVNDILPSIYISTTTSNDGNFTISWDYSKEGVKIFESVDGQQAVPLPENTGLLPPKHSLALNRKVNGAYKYILHDCVHNPSNGVQSCTPVSSKTVQVILPIPAVPGISPAALNSSNGEYTISWTSVGYALDYELYENTALVSDVKGLAVSKMYVSSSAKGTGLYKYQVRACNKTGCSNLSTVSAVNVAKPSVITSASLSLNKTTGVPTLTWAIPRAASFYEIRQQFNGGNWSDFGSRFASPTSLPPVSAAGTYAYQIRACDEVGGYTNCSGWVATGSESISLPSAPVITLNPINTTGVLSVSWGDPGNANRYVLKENGVDLPDLIINTSHGLTKQNGSYRYQVAACNVLGCGSFSSAKAVDVAKIGSLGSVAASLNQSSGVTTLSWGAVSGATTYRIQPYLNNSVYGALVSVTNPNTQLASITEAGNYKYQVTPCAIVGANTNCATAVMSNSVTPIVPRDASVLTLPLSSQTGIYSVRWREVVGSDRYEIYENNTKIASVSTLSYSFTSSNAKGSGQYTYEVKACKALCGPKSNSAKIIVNRTSSSSASSSSTGIAVLDKPLIDPLNDALDGDVYRGELSGTQSVGNDGSFNYNLPIVIPPGINGVQPNLSLSYNSNRRNGMVGWGWTIGGLSLISRCGASLIRDGYVDGIQHDDQYRYCLDGQRLIETSVNQFRTESESYLRIEKSGSYWTVTDNKGNVRRYGYNTDSYQSDNQSDAYVWFIDKYSDVSGNSWTVAYSKDDTQGTHYPHEIKYTQNVIMGTNHSVIFGYEDREDISTKYIAGSTSVVNKRLKTVEVKSYDSVIRTYTLAYQVSGQTYAGKVYQDPSKISRLNSVTLCFASSSCSKPVSFNWSPRETNDFNLAVTDDPDVLAFAQSSMAYRNIMLDIDGDGKLELYWGEISVKVQQADNTYKSYPIAYKHADINRDGFEDIIREVKSIDANIGIQFFLSNGVEISKTPSAEYTIPVSQTNYSVATTQLIRVGVPSWVEHPNVKADRYVTDYVDMNSDGLLDLIRYPANCITGFTRCYVSGAPDDISVAINNGDGFSPFAVWLPNWGETLLGSLGVNLAAEWFGLTYGDYNGDGLMDFIALSASDQSVSIVGINTGTGFTVELISKTKKYALIGDFNGDGITDLVERRAELLGNNVDIKYCGAERYVNNGQYIEPGDTSGIVKSDYHPDQCLSAVVDYNGDGLDDIVKWGSRWKMGETEPQEYEGYVYLSLGLDGEGKAKFASPIKYRDTALWRAAEARFDMGIWSPWFRFADYHASGAFEDSPYLQNKLGPNIIKDVDEGGRRISVQYRSLSSDKVYSYVPDTESSNQQAGEILTPRATARRIGVSQLNVSNGVGGIAESGGENVTGYSYTNAKRNTRGYGDLGFGTITKIETPQGGTPLKTVTDFYQDANQQYNLAGMIKRQQVLAGNSAGTSWQLISDNRYQWKVRQYNDDLDSDYESPHYFAYLYQSSNHSWDLDGSEIATKLTQNHMYSVSSCSELSASPAILTTTSGAADDVDYHADGVLLYTETATCDLSGSTSAVQIEAAENSDITAAGEARGLVETKQKLAWVGADISQAAKSYYSVRTQGFTYNNLGQLESETIEPDASAESGLKLTSTFAYNGYGSISSVTDSWDAATNSGLSVTTRLTTINESIDNAGVRTLVINKPQALSESTVFEPIWGQPHQQFDVNGLLTRTDYDEVGRPSLVSYADGTFTQMDYRTCTADALPLSNNCAWYAQSKTTGSSAQRTYYDGLSRAIGTRTIGLDGRAVYTVQNYNARGDIAQVVAPFFYGEIRNPTTNSYDALGRITDITYPDGSIERRTYSGLTHSITNRLNQTQHRYLNAAGWVMQSVDNNNTPVNFSYWPFGELHTTKVNNNDATLVTITYDALGRKTSLNDPNTGALTYTYNALDLLATQVDAKGQRTCYRYDALGRQTGRVDLANASCSGTNNQQWVYDTSTSGKGQLASLTGVNSDGSSYSETYTYTNYSLPQTTTTTFGGSSYAVTQYYDGYGRPIGVKYPTNYVAANDYNEYGQLAQVSDSTGSILWAANASDSLGNVTEFTLGNGVATTQTYDVNTQRIDTIRAAKGSLVIQDQDYGFDALGNLTSRVDRNFGVTQSFCYDNLNRLKAARFDGCSSASNDYTYDALGNLTAKEGITGAMGYGTSGTNLAGPHAVTSANGWSYQYDAIGNLTSATKAGQSARTVAYSAFNTPTSITQGSKFSTLVYGPNQERIKHSDSNGRVTKYVGGIYEEVTKAGVTQKIHYVGDFALVTQTGGVTPVIKHEYLHRDHIGSIVAISKSTVASANDVQWQSNGAWGERRYQQWNGPLDNLLNPASTAKGFTDHEHLDAVGLIHMSGRVYDPELGRFMSADPFVQAPYNSQSYNRYSYVFNNPLSFTDPSGFQSCQITEFFNATDSQTGAHLGTWSQTRQGASGNGTFCGQDALDFGRDQERQNQNWDYMTQNFQISYLSQHMQANGYATGFAIPIEGNSFAGAGCGIIGICLGDPVEDEADIAAAERVIGHSTLLIAGIVAPGPGGKAKKLDEVGEYLRVRGHHVHAKAAFKNHIGYDPKKGFSISNKFMRELGLDHKAMTAHQRQAFKELSASGRPNSMKEHTRIAVEALQAGGASKELARSLVAQSLSGLRIEGVRNPTNIPWY